MQLAKCITAAGRVARNTVSTKAASPMSPMSRSAPRTAPRRPLLRSSATTTVKPLLRSIFTMCAPM